MGNRQLPWMGRRLRLALAGRCSVQGCVCPWDRLKIQRFRPKNEFSVCKWLVCTMPGRVQGKRHKGYYTAFDLTRTNFRPGNGQEISTQNRRSASSFRQEQHGAAAQHEQRGGPDPKRRGILGRAAPLRRQRRNLIRGNRSGGRCRRFGRPSRRGRRRPSRRDRCGRRDRQRRRFERRRAKGVRRGLCAQGQREGCGQRAQANHQQQKSQAAQSVLLTPTWGLAF